MAGAVAGVVGTISKLDVIDSVNELIDGLAKFADRTDREVELIVRTDGTVSLMGADPTNRAGEPATSFEEIEAFDSFSDLWAFLMLGEAA